MLMNNGATVRETMPDACLGAMIQDWPTIPATKGERGAHPGGIDRGLGGNGGVHAQPQRRRGERPPSGQGRVATGRGRPRPLGREDAHTHLPERGRGDVHRGGGSRGGGEARRGAGACARRAPRRAGGRSWRWPRHWSDHLADVPESSTAMVSPRPAGLVAPTDLWIVFHDSAS